MTNLTLSIKSLVRSHGFAILVAVMGARLRIAFEHDPLVVCRPLALFATNLLDFAQSQRRVADTLLQKFSDEHKIQFSRYLVGGCLDQTDIIYS